jgi:single-stranded-DNA-specific exonuclease
VVEARLRWILPGPVVIDPAIQATADRLGLSLRVTELLVRRGVTDPLALERFFGAPAAGLHDPTLLPDAAIVLARITRTRRDRERVLVFGDFDADGLTGLAILTLALRRLEIPVETYVPSRLEEGHGLSLAAVEHARRLGVSLIVTVDCGSTSHAEIQAANASGIDVIVTDHHRVPPRLPAAFAVVNPHRPDSTYPERRLSGSGVAFKVAHLLDAIDQGVQVAAGLADLAAIGGVADLAPILGENRAIARLGLERLRNDPRPGIAALLRRANIDPARIDLETVAFAIAPRLNAAGRVGEASDAARLLLTESPEEAEALAETLENANRTRRDLMKTVVDEARVLAEEAQPGEAARPDSAVIVRGAWPVGIVGLVASRLVEDLGVPAVVGANLGPQIRASLRSDGSLDLAAALETCAQLFTRFGGHAGAAGFEMPAENWGSFRQRFLALAEAAVPIDRRPSVNVDLAVPAIAVDYALQRDLANLAPCGPGHPDPVIAILGLTVTRVRAAAGGHTQLTLRRNLDVIDGIAFGRPDLAESVTEGERLDVVGRVMSRAFGGFESLQVEIQDVATSAAVPESAGLVVLDQSADLSLAPVPSGGEA